jgi:hypothetical protein
MVALRMIPISAIVEEPARGTWVADVVTTERPTGAFELGEVDWTGAVYSFVLDGSRFKSRIVGGAGKLGGELPEKNYAAGVPWSTVARDIIREAGERSGALSFGGAASYYERARGSAGEALTALCEASGATWWVDRSGAVQFERSRPTSVVDETRLSRDELDVDGSVRFVVQQEAGVQPGQSVDGRTIAALRWQLEPERLTVECSTVRTNLDPPKSDDFYRLMYEAKVDSQNADGSVNVIANEKFFMRNVRLLAGLPGVRVIVKPGEVVAVGFLGGNRSKPFAQCFAQSSSASKAIGLVEDAVEIILPPFTFVGSVAGAPITGVMTAVIPKTLGKVIGPGSTRSKSQ